MGLSRLQNAIAGLPKRGVGVGVDEARALREAAGPKLNDDEADAIRKLLRDHPDRFTSAARKELGELVGGLVPVGARGNRAEAARFELARRYTIDVDEPSGLAFISPEHGFVVAADCGKSMWRVGVPDGKEAPDSEKLKVSDGAKRLAGLEGVAYDPKEHVLLVVSEDRNRLLEIEVDARRSGLLLGSVVKEHKLPAPGSASNKGFEGVAYLGAKVSGDGQTHLLAVHEGQPRRLAVLSRDADVEAMLELPGDMKDALKDLSDITVDPKTGHVFFLSDESETIFEAQLRISLKGSSGGQALKRFELVPMGATKLPVQSGHGRLQPEGLAFDGRGDLWVVCEGKRELLRLRRK